MAVYPFWANVASHVGRILKLQDSFQLRSIQRRLREQYGQRETVSRSAQRIIRSFVDWGVLQDGEKNGIYMRGKSVILPEPAIIAWLVEAYMHAYPNNATPLKAIIDATCFFPFRMQYVSSKNLTASSNRLELVHHGLDQDLVVLSKGFG